MTNVDNKTYKVKKVHKEPEDYLYYNKKKTKIKMKGKPKVMGLTGFALQAGIPFAYIAHKFDLFTFRNQGYAITGWGAVVIGIGLIVFRKSILKTLKEAEGTLGDTYRRSKLGNTMIILSGVVLLTNFFVEAFVVLFLVIAGATYISLPFYRSYDKISSLKIKMKKVLEDKTVEKQMENMENKIEL